MVSFDIVFNNFGVSFYFFCSGQQKPKSFLEIQHEQESDFTIKGTSQTTTAATVGGGGGVTTPTGNKMKVRKLLSFCVYSTYYKYVIAGVDLEQRCQGEAVTAASALVPPTSAAAAAAADHTHLLPEGEGPFVYGR